MPRLSANPKIRAAKVTKAVIEANGNLAQAGRKLGVTRQTVRRHVQANPDVKSVMATMLDKCGVTDDALAKKLKQLLEHTKKERATEKYIDDEGQEKSREILVDVDDAPVQIKAAELCLKVKGHIKTGEVNVDASQKTLQVFSPIQDSDFDGGSASDMISGLNLGLSQQRPS